MLTLMRRPDGNPAPLLVLQHGVGSFGRELCISYELDPENLVCRHDTPVQEPLVAGDLNGSVAGVPPDEVVTARGQRGDEHLRLRPRVPAGLVREHAPRARRASSRSRSATSTVTPTSTWVVGQQVNSLRRKGGLDPLLRLNPSGSGGLESGREAVPHHAGRRCGGRRRCRR